MADKATEVQDIKPITAFGDLVYDMLVMPTSALNRHWDEIKGAKSGYVLGKTITIETEADIEQSKDTDISVGGEISGIGLQLGFGSDKKLSSHIKIVAEYERV